MSLWGLLRGNGYETRGTATFEAQSVEDIDWIVYSIAQFKLQVDTGKLAQSISQC